MATRESRSAVADPGARLYDTDFYQWCMKMAALLRAGRIDEVDVENVAEEIQSLGKSQSREIRSRVRVIIIHLFKRRYQPEKATPSWRTTITDQRVEIGDNLRDNPSLRRTLPDVISTVYPDAVKQAAAETGLQPGEFPPSCPFTLQEVLGED